MRILLTGKNGQLGWELHRQLEQDYEVLAIGREDIDFRDSKYLASAIRQLPKFHLIVNAAGSADVERAEQEPFATEAINVEAAAILAAEADFRGIPMIHFSSDHVFGRYQRTLPYREHEKPNPVSVYGWSKLEGEMRIQNILEKHWIFRLSGLFGIRNKNFFTELLARHHAGKISRVANDHMISPNWTPLVAEAVAKAINSLFRGETIPWGLYHLSGSGRTTPHKFAWQVCEKVNDLWGWNMPLPVAVSSKELKDAAKRPRFSVLDSTRFSTAFRQTLPDWHEQFLRFIGGLQPLSTRQQTS
jgi:dTDP-4-dehydrorhamnose reductase